MHRILLYALVVALLYLAWDARRDEVLAAGNQSVSDGPSALLARAPIDPSDHSGPLGASTAASSVSLNPDLQARLEARVEGRGDVWTQFEFVTPLGPPAEDVLALAEAWMAAHFPEAGFTAKASTSEADNNRRARDPEPMALAERAPLEGEARERTPAQASDQDAGPPPIYVASLARIESLSGDLPAWFGLLDLALQPPGRRQFVASVGSDSALASGDTVWISDDSGQLLARVQALNGLGLEFDPAWPWIARQRRLFWTESGALGLSARQYRLVLEGNRFVPSWSGRLVLIQSR